MAALAAREITCGFMRSTPRCERWPPRGSPICRKCPGKVEVVLGDARLSLEREPPQHFDLLVLDAFSSDAIPVHLLTKEAFELYERHLKTNGVIAVHISNHYLDLEPVVVNLARHFGYSWPSIEYEETESRRVVGLLLDLGAAVAQRADHQLPRHPRRRQHRQHQRHHESRSGRTTSPACSRSFAKGARTMTTPLPSSPNPFLDSQVSSRAPLPGRSPPSPALIVFLLCLVVGLPAVGWRTIRRKEIAQARAQSVAMAQVAAVEMQFSQSCQRRKCWGCWPGNTEGQFLTSRRWRRTCSPPTRPCFAGTATRWGG